jgi:hypothetical protein
MTSLLTIAALTFLFMISLALVQGRGLKTIVSTTNFFSRTTTIQEWHLQDCSVH